MTIEPNPNYKDCRGIARIGIEGLITSTQMKTPAEVHDIIEGGDTVVVEHGGQETELIPAEYEGTKYVRTESNDTKKDNLLKQESC